jgi:glycine reductase
MSLRVVHYINQFFGQIGGEEKANVPPQVKDGPVGPGNGINAALEGKAEIAKTIICGDDYFNENTEEAKEKVREVLVEVDPDLVIAGPAFNAGRYGMACGGVAELACEEFNLPVISAMYPENPGYDMYKNYAYIIETGNSAAGMREAIPNIAKLVKSYIEQGGELGRPEEEGYMPRGLRKNQFVEERGSARAVKMLIKKIKGEEFETEFPMPNFDRVDPVAPIEDLADTKVALVTSGGIVPKGNPDRIESSSASKYGEYDISDYDNITAETHETAHGGYDPVYANQDPNRVLPVDVMRELEAEGVIGELHNLYYSTVGNGTAVASAKAFAKEIAEKLIGDGVQAVVLTST